MTGTYVHGTFFLLVGTSSEARKGKGVIIAYIFCKYIPFLRGKSLVVHIHQCVETSSGRKVWGFRVFQLRDECLVSFRLKIVYMSMSISSKEHQMNTCGVVERV